LYFNTLQKLRIEVNYNGENESLLEEMKKFCGEDVCWIPQGHPALEHRLAMIFENRTPNQRLIITGNLPTRMVINSSFGHSRVIRKHFIRRI
jgi:hypothetical protein